MQESTVNKMWKPEERSYHLLRELNVQPNVFYQTKVRNSRRRRIAMKYHNDSKSINRI